MNRLHAIRLQALGGLKRLERVFDLAFGSGLNPLRHLGALGVMMLGLLALSGVYLYVVIEPSAVGAYRTIERLSRDPWHIGGLMRSLHRYAADGLAVVTLAHLLREGLYGRYRGFRRFAWLTGIPLLLLYVNAIGGFWLNWDQLGQFSAMATAEWLDWLPIFGSPLTRNFLAADAVSDRLFSLFVFVHIGVSLLLVLGLWWHLARLARPKVFPPRRLALGTAITLVALALVAPVTSQAPANLAVLPAALAYDWLLLFVHPLTDATSPAFVWLALAGSLLALFLLPFVRPAATSPVARVDADHCTGCRRCVDDCPYAAVTMVPYPPGSTRQLAKVDADLCAGCGICVGACPSSSPLRNPLQLVTGIDLPATPIGQLRDRLAQGLAALGRQPRKIAVFGCDHGIDVRRLAGPDVAALSLVCAGQLPPSFVEYALRDGAAGVLITGCAEETCAYRLGQRWTAERLAGVREPRLRASIARPRIEVAWAGAGDETAVRQALQTLRQRITAATQALPVEGTPAHG